MYILGLIIAIAILLAIYGSIAFLAYWVSYIFCGDFSCSLFIAIIFMIWFIYSSLNNNTAEQDKRIYESYLPSEATRDYTFKVKENGKGFIAYNKNIIVELDNLSFKVEELSENPRTLTFFVDEYYRTFAQAESFVDFLRFIFHKFNKNTIYDEIKADIIKFNFIIYENQPKEYTINSEKSEIQKQPLTIDFNLNKIDINNSSEQQIASLEGINIAAAKKAIQYRDLHSGFKNFDEFAKVVKLKNLFISKVRPRIKIGDYNNTKVNTDKIEGRIVDF